MSNSFILLDKNDKHISLFSMQFISFVISCKELSPLDNEQTQGGFLPFAKSNLWMDSNGKLWWNNNIINPPKLRCKNILFLTSSSLCWQDNRSIFKPRCHPRHSSSHWDCRQLLQSKEMGLHMKNKPSMIKVVKCVSNRLIFSQIQKKTLSKMLHFIIFPCFNFYHKAWHVLRGAT